MYKKFSITIHDKKDSEKTLFFDVYQNNVSQKWAEEISKEYELFETERFKSWRVDSNVEDELVSNLNFEIETINNFMPNCINTKVKKGTGQQTLNYLHKIFEKLRGEIRTGTDNFNNAPDAVKNAIQNLNILIHRYEDYNNSKPSELNPNHPFASIVGTFKNRPRFPLQDEDYNYFTFNWKFGEVYINYCEVGKPILDVFKDDDELVGLDNIRPLHYYSADFMIKFGPDTPEWFYKVRLKKLRTWLMEKGFNPRDKKLSIGLIPVAKFNINDSQLQGLTPEKIVENLSTYQKLLSVKVI